MGGNPWGATACSRSPPPIGIPTNPYRTHNPLPRAPHEQKSIFGLVAGAPCRVDIEFKDAEGRPHKQTAVVKGKANETEELPLYSNKDDLIGEVCQPPCKTPCRPCTPMHTHAAHAAHAHPCEPRSCRCKKDKDNLIGEVCQPPACHNTHGLEDAHACMHPPSHAPFPMHAAHGTDSTMHSPMHSPMHPPPPCNHGRHLL